MKIISLLKLSKNVPTDKIAIVTPVKNYSYQQVCDLVEKLINILHSNKVCKGQRVVLIPDHDELAIFFIYAASAIGLQILMPYNLQDTAFCEWTNIIETSKPDHVIYLKKNSDILCNIRHLCHAFLKISLNDLEKSQLPAAQPVIQETDSVRNFLILFTSGTTGKPKAISISEALIFKRIVRVSEKLKFNSDSKVFMSGLINNTTGIIFSFGVFNHRATLFLPSERIVDTWPKFIEQWKITHIMLRPIAMKKFIDAAILSNISLLSLRVVAYGAAALSSKILEQGRALMACEWIQGYGLSETFGPFCWMMEEDHKNQLYKKFIYCVGKPDDTLEVSLYFKDKTQSNVGEVILRGSSLMEGYYNIVNGTMESTPEWFHTGDYGEFTEDGYLILKGRIANTILTENGHRIYPEEIENIIKEIPEIDDAVLLNWPSANNLGNSPILCISGSLTNYKTEYIRRIILNKTTHNLSPEKWPEYIYVCKNAFPKNQNDKVDKTKLLSFITPMDLITLFNEGEEYADV